MIYHLTSMKWKVGADEEKKKAAYALLERMGREIDVIQQACVGPDFGAEFDFGSMFAIKNVEDYEKYMNHPLHIEVDKAGLPLVEDMISHDLTDDPDPTIREKIEKIHADRYAGNKEVAELVKNLKSYKGSSSPDEK